MMSILKADGAGCYTAQDMERWQNTAHPALPPRPPGKHGRSARCAQHGAAASSDAQLQAGLLRVPHALDASGLPEEQAGLGVHR